MVEEEEEEEEAVRCACNRGRRALRADFAWADAYTGGDVVDSIMGASPSPPRPDYNPAGARPLLTTVQTSGPVGVGVAVGPANFALAMHNTTQHVRDCNTPGSWPLTIPGYGNVCVLGTEVRSETGACAEGTFPWMDLCFKIQLP